MRNQGITLEVYNTNNNAPVCVTLHRDFNCMDMLSKSDIEFLKRVNGVRKEMGLSIDSQSFNQHSFLSALAEAKSQLSRK